MLYRLNQEYNILIIVSFSSRQIIYKFKGYLSNIIAKFL
jgi:hypothetical protein